MDIDNNKQLTFPSSILDDSKNNSPQLAVPNSPNSLSVKKKKSSISKKKPVVSCAPETYYVLTNLVPKTVIFKPIVIKKDLTF